MTPGHWSKTGLTLLLLLVCLIAVNVIAFFLPVRLDVTEDRLYTIAKGTRSVLDGLQDPVRIKYYFSRSSPELTPNLKTYAQRVQELLEEIEAVSGGSVTVEVFDPKPDSDEEDWAQKYGITPVTLPSGTPVYFGAVVMVLDQEVALPFFDPRRERFLEYDLTLAIHKAALTQAEKVGLLSSLNLQGGPPVMQGQPPMEKWAFVTELEKIVNVEVLETTVEEIPEDISLLLVIHPKGFSDRARYALDQYVLHGGRVILLLDSNSRADGMSPMNRMSQQPIMQSRLPGLLEAWGIAYEPEKVVGDFQYATQVNTQVGVLRFPVWMSITKDALVQDHPLTTQLESLLFVEGGSVAKAEGSSVEVTPLLKTTKDSGTLDAMTLRYVQPQQLIRDLKPDQQERLLMALFTDTFKTAFPEGRPPKEPKQGEDATPDVPMKREHLAEAKARNSILVITDSDFLSDSFSVQKMNFLGKTIIQPTNDNLNLMLNAVEYLSGSEALMSIRSRGQFSRPFTRLLAMQRDAQIKYQAEEQLLLAKLEEVQKRLSSLQQRTGKSGRKEVILPPEVQEEIRQFRDEERQTRRKLREVRKILRQDIESLGNTLFLLNLVAVPLLIGVFGIVSYRRRISGRRA